MTGERSRWLPAVLAGLLGGAVAGLIDGALGLTRGGVGGIKALALPLAGLGLWGLAGAVAGGLYAGLCSVVGRTRRSSDPAPTPRAMALTAALLAAPLVLYDALAMFGGARASKIPGRLFLSLALAALGLGLVYLAARAGARALARWQEPGGTSRPVMKLLVALGGALLALAIQVANRRILPGLYSWFHVTLSLLFVLVLVLVVRFLLARKAPPMGLAVALVVAVVSATVGVALIRRSHGLLFLSSQRTQLLSLALAAVPLSAPRRRAAARHPGGLGPDQSAPPLPPGPRRPDADVVIITIDALRADHVGAYGYERNTTPHIDALARRGVRFERAYAQAPNTSFSVTSMLTGKYFPTLARLAPPEGHDTLAMYLRRYGWKTAAFHPEAQTLFFVQGDKLKVYRDSQFDFEYVKAEYMDAHSQISRIAEFFAEEEGKSERIFLWVHFFEPHESYEKWPEHDFGDRDIDRYDSEIAYTDAAVGRLLAYLTKHRPDSIVILAADHGEEFDEHGGRYHGKSLHDEQIRIPLIIAVPGVAPAVVEGPAELVDVAPTVLALLDIPIPVRMRGTDLGPWLNRPAPPSRRMGLAFAEVDELRMVASARDKLLCNFERGFCAYYDLVADPREQTNLAEARPERVAELQAELDDWLGSQLEFGSGESALERARLGDASVTAEVAALLVSAHAATRREAARLLAVVLPARPEIQAALAQARQGNDPEVRAWAAVAALRAGDRSASESLRKLLAGPARGDAELRTHAAMALAGAGEASVVPVLAEALRGCSDPSLCRRIVEALGAIGDRRAAAALVAHLDSVLTRREVVAALAKIDEPEADAALRDRLLRDEYVPVRIEAARALARKGGAGARSALETASKTEREPEVQAAIRQALASLRP